MKRKLLTLAGLACLSACTPSHLYVRADRSIYEAIAPEYRAYVEADTSLTPVQKDRRFRTVTQWKAVIEAAEKAHAMSTTVQDQ